MADQEHSYAVQVRWTGNLGEGTRTFKSYERSHDIQVSGKPVLAGSSDPAFRGDATRYNPEDLLVASLSACHMLWYLHLCSAAKIVVMEYVDEAVGTMQVMRDGQGQFKQVVLRPSVTIEAGGDVEMAQKLHQRAHDFCFIANSVNFPVLCEPHVASQAGDHAGA